MSDIELLIKEALDEISDEEYVNLYIDDTIEETEFLFHRFHEDHFMMKIIFV